MSSVIITFHQAGNRAKNKGSVDMPVPRLPDSRTEILTASATACRSLLRADANYGNTREDGGFVTVRAGANAIWVASGSNPTVVKPVAGSVVSNQMTGGTQGASQYLGANEEKTFGVNYNDYVSVIEN